MEVKNWSYEEYPEYQTDLEDAAFLETTGDEVFVTYLPDVCYADMYGHKLTLQIMVPQTRNEPDKLYPVVLYVQGSHWDRQDVYKAVPELSRLAAMGYVTAIVEYRGYDVAAFPAPVVDTRNAVRYMKFHAREFHGNPEQIILTGNSSGGHAAVYAAVYDAQQMNEEVAQISRSQIFTRSQEKELRETMEEDGILFSGISPKVLGIIDFYGAVSVIRDDSNPTTVNHCLPDSPEGMEMGHMDLREHPELKELLSVENHITPQTPVPPVLILHGTKDRTVNPACSEILYRKLKECGKEAEIVFLRGADHGGGEFWSPQVLRVVDTFIKKVISR